MASISQMKRGVRHMLRLPLEGGGEKRAQPKGTS
jgi:hypothetical protein